MYCLFCTVFHAQLRHKSLNFCSIAEELQNLVIWVKFPETVTRIIVWYFFILYKTFCVFLLGFCCCSWVIFPFPSQASLACLGWFSHLCQLISSAKYNYPPSLVVWPYLPRFHIYYTVGLAFVKRSTVKWWKAYWCLQHLLPCRQTKIAAIHLGLILCY